MNEHFFQCPYCWQTISMILDQSVSDQEYIEDCEVCCNPIQVNVQFEDADLSSFNATNIEQ